MGLTIHYGLRSRAWKPEKASEYLVRLRERALDLPFKEVGELMEITGPACDFNRCDREDPNRWLLIQSSQYVDHPPYRGQSQRFRYSYTVLPTHVGGVYSCTCPSWRNQSLPIERRTCKHLRLMRGEQAEREWLTGGPECAAAERSRA